MKPHYVASDDGYSLYGFEPEGLAPGLRKLFWGWVTEFALREKDRDLAKGLDKDGGPLKPISEETRKNRRSAMTPSGKGDPNAPPLTPGWQKSRTRSLLKGKAFIDHAEFWWGFDAFTHNSWAAILRYQADAGRDVFGLSPKSIKRVSIASLNRLASYRGGTFKEPKERPAIKVVIPEDFGQAKTIPDWIKHFRESAPANLPGRPMRPKAMSQVSGPKYNRLLQHVWNPPKAQPIPVTRPSPQPVVSKGLVARTVQRLVDWAKGWRG